MKEGADIKEIDLLTQFPEELKMLLLDRTTGENIYWATDSYEYLDESRKDDEHTRFGFYDSITIEKITGEYESLIRPRAKKSREEQDKRAKDKAEVFTPTWICNAQNNLVDEAWFGPTVERLFNMPHPDDPQNQRMWVNNEEKIQFPEGKTWKDYVSDIRLEITCGEAPYLANRYDATTGEYNENPKYRIGILDRKLRIVSENAKDSKEWILWAKIALRSTYGFEWQGDNLLLAREALFCTFIEHYIARFDEKKFNQNRARMMLDVAYIISWNVWQMDGLTYGLPGHEEDVKARVSREESYKRKLEDYERKKREAEAFMSESLFGSDDLGMPELIKPELEPIQKYEQFCVIKDFFDGVNLKKSTLSSTDFHDEKAMTQTFESVVNSRNNK